VASHTGTHQATAATVQAKRALSRVGVTAEQLLDQGGSVLTAGRCHLVGSLAQGFGNRGSDIDLHVMSPEIERPSPSFLMFVGTVPVDIEHYPASYTARILAKLPGDRARTALGEIALDGALDQWETRALTRWYSAIPLRPGDPSLLDEGQRHAAMAYLLREALHTVLRYWIIADLVSRSGRDAGHLWRLCGQAVLSLLCAARGLPPVGAKWLAARVERAGIAGEVRAAAADVSGSEDVARLLDSAGLAVGDALALGRIEADQTTPVRIGADHFALTRHGRLESRPLPKAGRCPEVLAATGAQELVAQLDAGLIRMTVNATETSRLLRKNEETP
jgi:hypothetical protein